MYVKDDTDVTKVFEESVPEKLGKMTWDTRDGSHPDSPMTTHGKRKSSDCDRQPESPLEVERHHAANNWHRNKEYNSPMSTDSPASYPKHVVVHSDNHRYSRNEHYDPPVSSKDVVSTPVLTSEHGSHGDFDRPTYRPSNYYGYNEGSTNNYQNPPRTSSSRNYMPELEPPPGNYGPPREETFVQPRRWACDYCQVASFVSYEEACVHEEECARQYHQRYGGRPHMSRGPIPLNDGPAPPGQQQGGLGALYHASQEVGTPMPPRHQMWNSQGPESHYPPHHMYHQGPPPPHHHQQHHGYHSGSGYHNGPPRYHGYNGYHNGRDVPVGRRYDNIPRPMNKARLLLAMPTDSDSLSDRQCYVRSEMVEIFAATEKDVSSRHSKGAQKLVEGQVGIRCVHCAHLRPRDRAERAVCYPSSISRIYQTVADMQRFHFEQCREIPMETRKIYKSLKTTRPRGVGSPQTYWVQSAKLLDLADTDNGIRFVTEVASKKVDQDEATAPTTTSESTV